MRTFVLAKVTCSQLIKDIMTDPNIQVIQQTHESFLDGLQLYENRLDKEYSLTDCISMQTFKKLGIIEVLTHDRHFTQEGFTILFLNLLRSRPTKIVK